MKRLKIFIAIVLLAAAILGFVKPKRKVQTPQEMILDSLVKIFSRFT